MYTKYVGYLVRQTYSRGYLYSVHLKVIGLSSVKPECVYGLRLVIRLSTAEPKCVLGLRVGVSVRVNSATSTTKTSVCPFHLEMRICTLIMRVYDESCGHIEFHIVRNGRCRVCFIFYEVLNFFVVSLESPHR